jgi:hypothetical protein
LVFHLFGTPFVDFLKGNGPKWSIWPTTGSFHSIFVDIYLSERHHLLKIIQIGAVVGEMWRIGSEK